MRMGEMRSLSLTRSRVGVDLGAEGICEGGLVLHLPLKMSSGQRRDIFCRKTRQQVEMTRQDSGRERAESRGPSQAADNGERTTSCKASAPRRQPTGLQAAGDLRLIDKEMDCD